MKLESAGSTPIAEILNPRGNLAKELEATAKKASWLSLMCGYCLAYHHDNAEAARMDEPTYKLPSQFREAARYNKAYKNCGLFSPMAPLRGAYRPTFWSRSDWGWIFDYWYSGGLDRGIEDLVSMLPQENRDAIAKELLK